MIVLGLGIAIRIRIRVSGKRRLAIASRRSGRKGPTGAAGASGNSAMSSVTLDPRALGHMMTQSGVREPGGAARLVFHSQDSTGRRSRSARRTTRFNRSSNVVVLPAPFGPSARRLPSCTRSESPSTASRASESPRQAVGLDCARSHFRSPQPARLTVRAQSRLMAATRSLSVTPSLRASTTSRSAVSSRRARRRAPLVCAPRRPPFRFPVEPRAVRRL